MAIKIVKEPISRKELHKIAVETFGDLVKAVVDIDQGVMAVGGELHADEEIELVEKEGSLREFVWGVNLYPEKSEAEWIEFDSMINLKPHFGNRTRGVDDAKTRERIRAVIKKLVYD